MSAATTDSQSSQEDLLALIAKLRGENTALTTALTSSANAQITMRVSEKGALSIYGMGRFPVTLYAEQWHRLNGEMPKVMAFIEANKAKLKTKAQSVVDKAMDKAAK